MIAIGCDHGGFDLKCIIIDHLKQQGVEFKDFGILENKSVDYPDIAKKVADAINSGECTRGILVCGTGIGMSIAANKIKGIRAAACSEVYSAEFCRLHNDANILCIGGRVIGAGTAVKMVDVFINTEFEGGRHSRRVDMISSFEAL